jgi:hypothetical protein
LSAGFATLQRELEHLENLSGDMPLVIDQTAFARETSAREITVRAPTLRESPSTSTRKGRLQQTFNLSQYQSS